MACLTTSAFILWMLGYPDRALQRANEAIALATSWNTRSPSPTALYHAGYLHLWRREAELVRAPGRPCLLQFVELLKGDLLIALGHGADAEPWFQQAFTIARSLDARMSQLRAVVRLRRLRWTEGWDAGALHAVYETFTEGFTTADLTEARALLETDP